MRKDNYITFPVKKVICIILQDKKQSEKKKRKKDVALDAAVTRLVGRSQAASGRWRQRAGA